MLKRVVITNYLGETMEYRIDGVQAENPSGLIITNIDGLGPVKADINMTDLTTTDGGLFNSARLQKRNIVIDALFTHASDIDQARLMSYKMFPIKRPLTFYIETGVGDIDNPKSYHQTRGAFVKGYVESNEPKLFEENTSCRISIVCESPYFESQDRSAYGSFSSVTPLFRFAYKNEGLLPATRFGEISNMTQKEITYEGDADTGVTVSIYVLGDAQDVEIYNVDTNQKMILDTDKLDSILPSSVVQNRDKFVAGDKIVITTYQKNKTVTFVRDGERFNGLNMIGKDPGWFTLSKGINHYTFKTKTAAEDSHVKIVITAPILYEGV